MPPRLMSITVWEVTVEQGKQRISELFLNVFLINRKWNCWDENILLQECPGLTQAPLTLHVFSLCNVQKSTIRAAWNGYTAEVLITKKSTSPHLKWDLMCLMEAQIQQHVTLNVSYTDNDWGANSAKTWHQMTTNLWHLAEIFRHFKGKTWILMIRKVWLFSSLCSLKCETTDEMLKWNSSASW